MIWFMQVAPLFLNFDGNEKPVGQDVSEDLYGLWQSLLEAIEPTSEQRRTIVAFTQGGANPIPDLQRISEDALALLDRFEAIIHHRNK